MHPACQKWTSDLSKFELGRSSTVTIGYLPANSSTAHLNGDLAGLQALATLDILDFGDGLRNPQVVIWIGVHADVGLGDGGSGRHGVCGMGND